MYPSPVVTQALAREHVAELRRRGGRARIQNARRPERVVDIAMRATGWLLVDVGLRLAAPRSAMDHAVARGHR